VEVCPGPYTRAEAVDQVAGLLRRAGKEPVVMRQFVPSFIVNRIQNYISMAVFEMLANGWATPEEIDRAVKLSLGVRLPAVGVVQSLDFTGLDLVSDILKEKGISLPIIDDKVSAGRRRLRLYQVTEAGRAAHLDWLRGPVDPATVAQDLGLHLMRFVMMENNLEREEVLAFLKAVADALGDFVSLMERYLAADSPGDRPWAEKPAPTHGRLALEHGIATHRVSLQWARSAMEALAMPDPPQLPPPPNGSVLHLLACWLTSGRRAATLATESLSGRGQVLDGGSRDSGR
jgi:hypothetical protein